MSYIKKFREDYGYSNNNQVSKHTGIRRSSLDSIEKRGTPISETKAGNVRKMSKAVRASMDDFYDLYDEK